jgi:hypothetical protein
VFENNTSIVLAWSVSQVFLHLSMFPGID